MVCKCCVNPSPNDSSLFTYYWLNLSARISLIQMDCNIRVPNISVKTLIVLFQHIFCASPIYNAWNNWIKKVAIILIPEWFKKDYLFWKAVLCTQCITWFMFVSRYWFHKIPLDHRKCSVNMQDVPNTWTCSALLKGTSNLCCHWWKQHISVRFT